MLNHNTFRTGVMMLAAAMITAGCETMGSRREDAHVTRGATASAGMRSVATETFAGVKADTGRAVLTMRAGRLVLTLSDDFVVPETPAPHWQVVDGRGNVYLLQRLVIKDDKFNKSITLPAYVRDVAKVQIWCAFAETLLGEASFPMVVTPAAMDDESHWR